MIPLLQTKTADTAHTGIFASDTRPLSRVLGGAWGLYLTYMKNKFANVKLCSTHVTATRWLVIRHELIAIYHSPLWILMKFVFHYSHGE